MDEGQHRQTDPFWWCVGITFVWALLAAIRLEIPSKTYFDEVHYIPAARALIELAQPANVEHPLLGKALFALGIETVGDEPLGWRIAPYILGVLGLFAFTRMMWFATFSRAATLIAGLLLATGFNWLIHARTAMLDGPMAAFVLLGGWAVARACREPDNARWLLALCGVLMGLSLGTKWSAAPLLVLPGLAFLWAKWRDNGAGGLLAREGGLTPGVGLVQATLLLGVLPLATYWLTFAPAFFYANEPLSPFGIVEHHKSMLYLQSSVVERHPYQSVWWQWVLDARAIWYFYEPYDGAQRGIMLVGNPATMWLGLAALALCTWRWVRGGDALTLAPVLAWFLLMALWIVAAKPVQFYFHYLLPGIALMAALAIVLGRWWDAGKRWPAFVMVTAATACFAYFWPILTAGALENDQAFLRWAWWSAWR